jgi:hypothetical protein
VNRQNVTVRRALYLSWARVICMEGIVRHNAGYVYMLFEQTAFFSQGFRNSDSYMSSAFSICWCGTAEETQHGRRWTSAGLTGSTRRCPEQATESSALHACFIKDP